MLEFYYDFMDVYVDRRDFQYVEMDTDSAYVALSRPTLEEVIRPQLRQQFYEAWHHWLPSEACPTHRDAFIFTKMADKPWHPHPCCREAKAHDKRTPGLFKVEWEGEGIVALCSKTYYCYGRKDKLSCKGLSKHQNRFTKNKYLNVLKTKQSGSGKNRGFCVKNNTIYTYIQERAGLSYFYGKRKVMDDGISTLAMEV
jgi:hypothetical protein